MNTALFFPRPIVNEYSYTLFLNNSDVVNTWSDVTSTWSNVINTRSDVINIWSDVINTWSNVINTRSNLAELIFAISLYYEGVGKYLFINKKKDLIFIIAPSTVIIDLFA